MIVTRRRKKRTVVAVCVLTLALAGTAMAYFLPKRARYDGTTSHQGLMHFKVRKYNIVEVWGHLPLPKGQTCHYDPKHRLPYRFVQYDPTGNGPWSMNVHVYHKSHTRQWMHLHLQMSGQWDSSATNGTGTIKAILWDRHGKCQTRPDLTWELHRTQ